eukprot:TRINITY_DN12638_c0_g1_i1.p1 TRINITY_DN12638_c0_g1~~TRINITY_DN12638_c0_g1_i1.p1  ORF type:complete len:322 (-),score=92.65 TRINITY_DN12638_c0_g1_i1:287-1252(-)
MTRLIALAVALVAAYCAAVDEAPPVVQQKLSELHSLAAHASEAARASSREGFQTFTAWTDGLKAKSQEATADAAELGRAWLARGQAATADAAALGWGWFARGQEATTEASQRGRAWLEAASANGKSLAKTLLSAATTKCQTHAAGVFQAEQCRYALSVGVFVSVFAAMQLLQRLMGAFWRCLCLRRKVGRPTAIVLREQPAVAAAVDPPAAAASAEGNQPTPAAAVPMATRVNRSATPPPRQPLADLSNRGTAGHDNDAAAKSALLDKLNTLKQEEMVASLAGIGSKTAGKIVEMRPLADLNDLYKIMPKFRADKLIMLGN